jgi:large subunit ribosomal protein L23
MKSAFDTIIRPIISEKADWARDEDNVYSFEVLMGTNKIEIRKAVEEVFDVKVAKVRTSILRGKMKRVGKTFGKKRNWKKAFVTLQEGHSIDLFEGV